MPEKTTEQPSAEATETMPPKPTQKESEEKATVVAKEDAVPYQAIPSFMVITTPELKKSYLQADSNFIKILSALDCIKLQNVIYTEYDSLQSLLKVDAIWCIGLEKDENDAILRLNHPNLLTSPNINMLANKEEKQAMYIPLKAFVTTNIGLISDI